MLKSLRRYISPYFLVKHYLLRDIKNLLNNTPFKGRILDVGCGEKPFKYLFRDCVYEGIDFKNYSINKDFKGEFPDFFFDKNYNKFYKLPFPNNSFNHSVAFQVLEHHKKPEKMISEMVRITKKEGFILISVPFLGGIHEEPYDFQRYTKYGLIELFKKNNCKILEVLEEGSLPSTISMLLNEYLNDFATRSKFTYFLSVILYPPFLFFSYLSLFMDKIFKSRKIFFNYLILAQK